MVDNFKRRQESTFVVSFVKKARDHIASLLGKLPTVLKDQGDEIALQVICDELRKMPVPLLGTFLAATVERVFGTEQGKGQTVVNAIEMLQAMQTSDEAFQRELERLNIYLPEIKEEIAELERLILDQQVPCLKVVSAKTDLNYPVEDNEIHLVLANTGGGSVTVEEIYLDAEKWEPDTTVDYSIPAAPWPILFLKAKLSVDEAHYPLFRLNQASPRIFNEGGAGAERLIIQLSSLHNARYSLRLRIPYLDLASNESDTLYHPPLSEAPIDLSFCYAPGWNKDVAPQSVLERKKVLQDMEVKFRGILSIFEEVHQSDPSNTPRIDEMLKDLGIAPYLQTVQTGLFGSFLEHFIPPLVAMAILEKRQQVLEVILRILCYLSEYEVDEERTVHLHIEELATLANNQMVEQVLESFMKERDFSRKMQLLPQILAGMKPLI
jgi:hypothetical protein